MNEYCFGTITDVKKDYGMRTLHYLYSLYHFQKISINTIIQQNRLYIITKITSASSVAFSNEDASPIKTIKYYNWVTNQLGHSCYLTSYIENQVHGQSHVSFKMTILILVRYVPTTQIRITSETEIKVCEYFILIYVINKKNRQPT